MAWTPLATHFYGSKQFRHFVCCLCIGHYGCGIYLTNDMTVAMDHATKEDSNIANVFICNGLTGRYCKGKPGIKEAPVQDSETYLEFDCTVDDEDQPKEYCFFFQIAVFSWDIWSSLRDKKLKVKKRGMESYPGCIVLVTMAEQLVELASCILCVRWPMTVRPAFSRTEFYSRPGEILYWIFLSSSSSLDIVLMHS